MNSFKSMLFLLAGVTCLSFATAENALKTAETKKEGEPDEWNNTINELWKRSEDAEKKMSADIEKLKESVAAKASFELYKAEKLLFKALVEKVTAAKKTYDTSKKAEDATAVSVAGIAAVKGFETLHEKYGAALKALATAETAEHGTIAELKYAKKRFLGSVSGAFMYTVLPLMAASAFVLV